MLKNALIVLGGTILASVGMNVLIYAMVGRMASDNTNLAVVLFFPLVFLLVLHSAHRQLKLAALREELADLEGKKGEKK